MKKKYLHDDDVLAGLIKLALTSAHSNATLTTTYGYGCIDNIKDYYPELWRLIGLISQNLNASEELKKTHRTTINFILSETRKNSVIEIYRKSKAIKIATYLQSNGVDILLLKGSALNFSVYKDSANRYTSDIDILVKKRDYQKTIELLGKEYTRCGTDQHLFTELFQTTFVDVDQNIDVIIDLHSSLTYPTLFNINEGDIWKRSICLDKDIKAMSWEHQLILISISAFRNMDYMNYYLVDFHEMYCNKIESSLELEKIVDQTGTRIPFDFYVSFYENWLGSTYSKGRKNIFSILINYLVRKKEGKNNLVTQILQAIALYSSTKNKAGVLKFHLACLSLFLNSFLKRMNK
jgi:hypothetical protein